MPGVGKTSSGCCDDPSYFCSGVKHQSELEEAGLCSLLYHLSTLTFFLLPFSFLQALQLLSLLILTPSTSPSYSLHLSQLDPLPVTNDGIFWKFHEHQQLLREANDQNTLEQEINRFIRAGQSLSITTRGPGLRRLTDMIHGCRSDVSELLQCGNDSVLRLVQGLVGVASSHVTTPTVAMEMGGCLGELGGLDLNCIALPTISTNGESRGGAFPYLEGPLHSRHILPQSLGRAEPRGANIPPIPPIPPLKCTPAAIFHDSAPTSDHLPQVHLTSALCRTAGPLLPAVPPTSSFFSPPFSETES